MRGEWNAQTGAELQVRQVAEKDLLGGEALPADAVLCASHLLGVLAERKLLAPVPPAILSVQWGDVFELFRLREAAWGQQILGRAVRLAGVDLLRSRRPVGKTAPQAAAVVDGI